MISTRPRSSRDCTCRRASGSRLVNDGGNRSHWIEVLLVGAASNRDGYGAKVRVRAGAINSLEERKGGMSYQSAHDPRLHFGRGSTAEVDSVEVRWPGGNVDRIGPVRADQMIVVKEGQSRSKPVR